MDTNNMEEKPAYYNRGVTFKTKLAGYEKRDVDEYLSNLHENMQASVASYEEKIEQLKNNLKMVTKELETAKSNYSALEIKHQELAEKMKLVEDQSANIERLMTENANMKKQMEENENYISITAELKTKNAFLETSLQQAKENEEQIIAQQKALENTIYQNKQESKEAGYQYKSQIAQLDMKMKIAEERHHDEMGKIHEMLLAAMEQMEAFGKNV